MSRTLNFILSKAIFPVYIDSETIGLTTSMSLVSISGKRSSASNLISHELILTVESSSEPTIDFQERTPAVQPEEVIAVALSTSE
jgi:hypothetical protein